MKYRTRISLLLVVALVVLALGGLNMRQAQAADKDTVIIGFTDSAGSLDPADAYDFHAGEILQNIDEGLLRFKVGGSDVEPGIATDLPKISDDGLTYTFTLKDNLQFADGTPLTAQVMADSIKRTQTLKGQIEGLVTSYVDTVSAPDAKTVVFKLQRPVGFFQSLVATSAYYPANPKIYAADKLNPFPASIDGNGPYRLVSYKAKEQAVLAANPKYSGDQPLTKNIILRYFAGAPQLAAAVEKGEVDIAWRSLTIADIVRLKKTKDINVYTVSNGRIQYLGFNQPTKPFDNVKIRQAIAYMINRDEVIDRAYQGQLKALTSQIPPSYPFVTDAFKKMYNSPQVDKGVALLTEAGYTKAKPLTIDLYWPLAHYGQEVGPAMEVIKTQLEKSGLIKVTVKSVEWATYVKTASQGGYGFYLLGWFPDYPDTDNYQSPWADSKQSPGQGISYNNPKMDDLLHKAAASADPKVRADLYAQTQDLWAQDVVTIPLYMIGEYTVYKNGIVGADKIGATMMMNYKVLGHS